MNQEQGKCPKCQGENINYGPAELIDEAVRFETVCEDCKCEFYEYYSLSFSEQIVKGE